MAKRIKHTSFDHLTTDLVYNTLSRLPVKTLIRFKSVCKTWYAVIENPNFAEQHQKLQTTGELDATFSYMLVTSTCHGFTKLFSLLYFGDTSHKLIGSKLAFLWDRVSRVVGICNGLVCLCSYFSNPNYYIICNPTTRQFRKIPPSKLPRRGNNIIFLWFASYTNDYEIIRIVCSFVDTNSIREAPVLRGEVYAKGTDKWIEIKVKFEESSRLRGIDKYFSEAVVINEVFYWKVNGYNRCIPFFDMRKRVFDVIEFPPMAYSGYINSQLHGIKDEVALITFMKKRFEMWQLNEDKTWTKMHKFDFSSDLSYPINDNMIRGLGSTRKGEFVFAHRHDDSLKLFSYGIDSQKLKCLHDVDVDVAGFNLYSAYLYTESLTPVN